MQEDCKEIIEEWVKAAISFSITVWLLLLMCAICGCSRTHYVPVETVRTEYVRTDSSIFNAIVKMMRETERMKQNTSDSLIHRIKETTKVNEDGDTIDHRFIEYIYMSSKEKAEYEKTIKEKNDSIVRLNAMLNSQKTDSVAVPYPVERKLTKWQQAKMDFGGVALCVAGCALCVLIGLIVWLVRVKRKR